MEASVRPRGPWRGSKRDTFAPTLKNQLWAERICVFGGSVLPSCPLFEVRHRPYVHTPERGMSTPPKGCLKAAVQAESYEWNFLKHGLSRALKHHINLTSITFLGWENLVCEYLLFSCLVKSFYRFSSSLRPLSVTGNGIQVMALPVYLKMDVK